MHTPCPAPMLAETSHPSWYEWSLGVCLVCAQDFAIRLEPLRSIQCTAIDSVSADIRGNGPGLGSTTTAMQRLPYCGAVDCKAAPG